MAKETTSSSCNSKTKKRKISSSSSSSSSSSLLSSTSVFSESEINAAELLIQLSGDSESSNRNDAVVSVEVLEFGAAHHDHDQQAMSDTTTFDLISTASKDDEDEDDDNDDPTTIFEIGPHRKHKRFRSLCEIYSLTNPLI
ncbi:hypothetical protein CsatB_015173 [Cannabis sativa]|uniref:Uncharacterized protein n=1 Tax=Cannabis sativa TaxID=3483 RepID=A0A803R8A9_CANSA